MIKVKITNKLGREFGATFKTQAEVDAWIAQERRNGSWGKVAGVYNGSILNELEKVGAVEIVPEGDHHYIEKLYQIQDQFTIEQSDITNEIKEQKAREYAEANEKFGNEFIREVLLLNKRKVEQGIFTIHTLDQMDADPTLQKIERACRRGAIPTLKYLVVTYSGPYFTSEEKQKFIKMIDSHLGA